MINWIIKNQIQVMLSLKKPVNNIIFGNIQEIKINKEKTKWAQKNNENKENLIVKTIFGKEEIIPYKQLESINFNHMTALIQKKSDTSLFSKLGYKILQKFKPSEIVMVK